MKRLLCLLLLCCMLLSACATPAEPQPSESTKHTFPSEATEVSSRNTEPVWSENEDTLTVQINSAFEPYLDQYPNAFGVLMNEPVEQPLTPTIVWSEAEYECAYIIPKYVDSYVNLYGMVWEEEDCFTYTDKAVQSVCAEDGCIIFSELVRPEGYPMWYLEIVSPFGQVAGMPLTYNGRDGTPPIEPLGAVALPELVEPEDATFAKPVIYLYPEIETEVSVALDYQGELTCTYPTYNDGWTVTAQPDGTLTDAEGQTYSYLYWEGETPTAWDFSTGFCVAGRDTAEFLEWALAELGLTRREANEFIVYWLPLMEPNSYNVISFQTDTYTDIAKLTVSPAPDSLIRVFMAWYPTDTEIEIAPQALVTPVREGFTAVEWGGSQVG